jgi:hypothetical protein
MRIREAQKHMDQEKLEKYERKTAQFLLWGGGTMKGEVSKYSTPAIRGRRRLYLYCC